MLLQVSGISKSYGTRVVLQDITLQIQPRERIGLVGVNGAGKSTLIRIIAGEDVQDSGDLFKSKDLSIGYLEQNTGFPSERTIEEELNAVFADLLAVEAELRQLESQIADPELAANPDQHDAILKRYASLSDTFQAEGGYEIHARIRGVLHGMGFADVDPNTSIRQLSGGQKTRLALAKLLLTSPDLLLLDEPTNHLDIPTLTWLERYLQNYPGAVLVVSHDRYFLDAIIHTIYEIERTACKRYTGNYSRFIETKAANYETELKHYEQQQQDIERMEDFIRRNIARASTTKRAQSRRKALERMDRMQRPAGELRRANFTFDIDRQTGKEVLRASDLSAGYDTEQPLFQQVSIHLNRGESVALIGPNGIGKTTLLRTLTGTIMPISGSITWGSHVKIGYYDQEQAELNPHNSVLDEVWNTFRNLEEARVRTVLGNFLFSGEDVLKKVSTLSGGERARVALAKLMLLNANVLILDEPTNHLDLYSREVLESALLEFEGTILFISHDRYFLNKMAERIIDLTAHGVEYFLGNYDDYLAKKRELVEIAAEQANGSQASQQESPTRAETIETTHNQPSITNSTAQDERLASKQDKREERRRQRRMEQLEQEIVEREAAIAELERKLATPKVYLDHLKTQEITTELEHAKILLNQHYAEWGELSS